MKLLIDKSRFDYPTWNMIKSWCRLRIYQEGERFVVIATELKDSGVSITNAAESLWSEVVRLHTVYDLKHSAVFIEHYDEVESYGRAEPLPVKRHRFDYVIPLRWHGSQVVSLTWTWRECGEGDDFEGLVRKAFDRD